MAKDTNRRINANLMDLEFKKLLEEARRMVQHKKGDAAYHVLQHMNLTKNEDNPALFRHIPDRQLCKMIGVGNSTVSNARQRLIQERRGRKKVVKNVDTSQVKYIGSGSESVYLYYFPAYELKFLLYTKYVDDSHETLIYECNIGKTKSTVPERVAAQIGQQLPGKPKIALIIKTNDCDSLETEIHDELKKQRKWLDPASENVVGEEWFRTNPTEVERIFKSIDEKRRKANSEKLE